MCVHVCVHACVCACVHACVQACVCVMFVRTYVGEFTSEVLPTISIVFVSVVGSLIVLGIKSAWTEYNML